LSNHDAGFKKIFSQPEAIEKLIRGFVSHEWVEKIDFSTLRLLPTEKISNRLDKRFHDIVWRVNVANSEMLVCLMMEFQSTPNRYMPQRMMTYVGLLMEHLRETKQMIDTDRGRLFPPILPFVLYSGQQPWNYSCEVASLIYEMDPALSRFSPRMAFFLLQMKDLKEKDLAEMSPENFVAALFRVEHARTEGVILERAIELHALVRQSPTAETLLPAIGAWFDGVFRTTLTSRGVDAERVPRFENLEGEQTMLAETLGNILDERHEKGREEGRVEGRVEGLQEGEARGIAKGRVEGALASLLKLVEMKFGAISDDDKERLSQLDHEQITHAFSRILTATTLEEIL
jgi:predicted transposase YdaD